MSDPDVWQLGWDTWIRHPDGKWYKMRDYWDPPPGAKETSDGRA